ncbi:MAG: class I SAM-dependent methyltransferase [Dehalococcoidales bacterium]|nr:class I SAM-dependent methyltransferase [Dehalococcoidales bacterium]
MADIEIYLKEKLNPLYRVWYGAWVYWWPLWRSYISGPKIMKKWTELSLVKEGQYFLDFGCGTGDFTIPAARIVGRNGKVFALDCNPKQLEIVTKKARKAGVNNIETIPSEQQDNLADESIDIVWMCDVIHEIRAKREVLEEVYRVLKNRGTLIIYDSLKDKVVNYTDGLFTLEKQDGKLMKFLK